MYWPFFSEHTAFIAVPYTALKETGSLSLSLSLSVFLERETQFCFCDSEVNLYTIVRKISCPRKLTGRYALTKHDKYRVNTGKRTFNFSNTSAGKCIPMSIN